MRAAEPETGSGSERGSDGWDRLILGAGDLANLREKCERKASVRG